MRISDWSSDVCSSDLGGFTPVAGFGRFHSTRHALRIEFRRNRDKSLAQPAMAWVRVVAVVPVHHLFNIRQRVGGLNCTDRCMTSEQFGSPLEDQGGKPRPLNQERYEQKAFDGDFDPRSEEHTSELQSLMRLSYAVFCL